MHDHFRFNLPLHLLRRLHLLLLLLPVLLRQQPLDISVNVTHQLVVLLRAQAALQSTLQVLVLLLPTTLRGPAPETPQVQRRKQCAPRERRFPPVQLLEQVRPERVQVGRVEGGRQDGPQRGESDAGTLGRGQDDRLVLVGEQEGTKQQEG
uniref:(northern house mosquito) hypothetical protein n=1 Tax=Culex pipiens TaxID=7175 RepID=A0A8D8IJ65_CULPI